MRYRLRATANSHNKRGVAAATSSSQKDEGGAFQADGSGGGGGGGGACNRHIRGGSASAACASASRVAKPPLHGHTSLVFASVPPCAQIERWAPLSRARHHARGHQARRWPTRDSSAYHDGSAQYGLLSRATCTFASRRRPAELQHQDTTGLGGRRSGRRCHTSSASRRRERGASHLNRATPHFATPPRSRPQLHFRVGYGRTHRSHRHQQSRG